VDDVLVAAGRQSNTADLNLTAAGLRPGKRGLLKVDAHCRTEVPHIFAAGDVIGAPALAATSMEQARLAICVAFEFDYKDVVAPILPTGSESREKINNFSQMRCAKQPLIQPM
jgi:NAD(P) transhydrogenase